MSEWFSRLWQKLLRDLDERFDPELWPNIFKHIFNSLIVILIACIVIWIARRFLNRILQRAESVRGVEHRRRIETITSLAGSTIKYAVYIAAVLAILSVWGVADSASIAFGTAALGAAVGFGSQGLVQDVITGLSILAEDQLAVGDYVEVGGKAGVVEEIGLRVIKLRDHLGVQHVIFNRTISVVSNFPDGSAFFSRTLDTNLTSPMAVMAGSAEWQDFILPFNATGAASPPSKLSFNLNLLGKGRVQLKGLTLKQDMSSPPIAMATSHTEQATLIVQEIWWSDQSAGLVGGIAGGLLGLIGTLIGILSSMGHARGFVLFLIKACAAAGVLSVIVGIIALTQSQPYGVYYPLLLTGVLAAAIPLGMLPAIKKRYDDIELRRMQAMDA